MTLSSTGHAALSKVVFPTADGTKLNARIYEPALGAKVNPAILLVEGSGKSHFEEDLESSPFWFYSKGRGSRCFC